MPLPRHNGNLSYDLKLFPVPDGASIATLYQRIAEEDEEAASNLQDWLKRPVSDSVRSEMRRLADALKRWRPALEEFRPKSPRPWIELNDPELPVQFQIYERMATITLPYFRDGAMIRCAVESFAVFNEVAGYVPYDPQLGRQVSEADFEAMLAVYVGTDLQFPGAVAKGPQPLAPKRKPWWKVR